MRYLASKSGVTLKTGLGFVQDHWKWHHLIDRIRVPVLFALHSNYGDILYCLRDIATYWKKIAKFLDPICIYPPRRNSVKMFDAGKTRMNALPYGEKNYDDMLSRFHLIPKRNRRTDRRTELLYQYRASVC